MKIEHCFKDLVSIVGCPKPAIPTTMTTCKVSGKAKPDWLLVFFNDVDNVNYAPSFSPEFQDVAGVNIALNSLAIGTFVYTYDSSSYEFTITYQGALNLVTLASDNDKWLWGCSTIAILPPLVPPPAPLMVNDLPDIDTDMLEKVAKSNMDSYLQQFAEISNYAWELLQQDVLAVLAETVGVNFENVLYQSQSPNIYTPLTVVPSTSNLSGLRMAIGRAKYVRYYLKGFWLASVQPSVAVTVKVINLATGVVMDTFSVVTDAFEPLTYVEVGKFYTSKTDLLNIGVVLDANSPALYLLNCGGMASDCGCSQQTANTIETPFQIDPNLPFVFENFIYAGTSYYQIGLCLDGEIVCSIEDFICRNKMHLRFAFRELVGALYFRKARVPDGKINFWKSLLPEELKALEQDGMNRYKSNLKRIVKGLPLKGLCVDCFGTERAGYSAQSNV